MRLSSDKDLMMWGDLSGEGGQPGASSRCAASEASAGPLPAWLWAASGAPFASCGESLSRARVSSRHHRPVLSNVAAACKGHDARQPGSPNASSRMMNGLLPHVAGPARSLEPPGCGQCHTQPAPVHTWQAPAWRRGTAQASLTQRLRKLARTAGPQKACSAPAAPRRLRRAGPPPPASAAAAGRATGP